MAGEAIEVAFVNQFSDMVHVAAQQNKARLRPYVQIKQIHGEKFAYDGLGVIEAQEVVGRHQPQQFADANHLRRRLTRRRFVLTLPIDAADERTVLIAPDSLYAAACARAMERVFDKVVNEAMFASVYTGQDMTTEVTFANDGGLTVTATGGLTYAKLLESTQKFIDADVNVEVAEKMVAGISGDEHTTLMGELELTSGDFSRQMAVDKGRMVSAAGFDLVHFAANAARPILSVAAAVRSCFGMSSRAICVGMSKEMSVKIEPRPDLIETKQVTIVFDFGAVRTEGVLIQKWTTTE